MSAYVFNAVIDWALSELDPSISVKLGDERISYLAYADDIALMATTPEGLQTQLDKFAASLAKSGLSISTGQGGKSASLRIDIDGEAKKWVVNPTPFLNIDNSEIPALNVVNTYKYFGIDVSALGSRPEIKKMMDSSLQNLTQAPLKPQQRLFILQAQLIPKLYHQLVLSSRSTARLLKWGDASARSAVRKWLRLPMDTTKAYFHADAKDGGLGIPSLQFIVPLLRKSRMENLFSSNDPVIEDLITNVPSFKKKYEKACQLPKLEDMIISSTDIMKEAWRTSLVKSCDGKGLAAIQHCGKTQKWVTSGTKLLSGSEFIGCVKIRGNLMPTSIRKARGRPRAPISCDCCGRNETLGHILQSCPRSYDTRIKRHNHVLDCIICKLQQKGYLVNKEPAIPTAAGIRRPDFVVKIDEFAYVVDVTVGPDNVDLDVVHNRKVDYYKVDDIKEWVLRSMAVQTVTFSAVALNWRGAIAPMSLKLMKEQLKLSQNTIELISLKTLLGGYYSYMTFCKSTYRVGIL